MSGDVGRAAKVKALWSGEEGFCPARKGEGRIREGCPPIWNLMVEVVERFFT